MRGFFFVARVVEVAINYRNLASAPHPFDTLLWKNKLRACWGCAWNCLPSLKLTYSSPWKSMVGRCCFFGGGIVWLLSQSLPPWSVILSKDIVRHLIPASRISYNRVWIVGFFKVWRITWFQTYSKMTSCSSWWTGNAACANKPLAKEGSCFDTCSNSMPSTGLMFKRQCNHWTQHAGDPPSNATVSHPDIDVDKRSMAYFQGLC